MIDPLESEVVPSRKWKWFKKSEKRETNLRSRASSLGNSTQIEDDRLRVENAFEDNQGPAAVKVGLNDSKGTCERLLDDLLFGVISQDSGCNESKLSFTEVKIKESRPSPVSPNTKTLPFGESGCQGCGTEQVHECEEEDLNGKEEKVEKKTGGAAMEGFIRKLGEMDIQGEVESSPWVDRNMTSDAQGKVQSENVLFASDIIKEVINRVTDNGLSSTEGENECPLKKHWLISKEDRVKKYLDFVQLWLEVKSGGESQKRREANLVWKEKIEEGQSLSEVNYLEQVGHPSKFCISYLRISNDCQGNCVNELATFKSNRRHFSDHRQGSLLVPKIKFLKSRNQQNTNYGHNNCPKVLKMYVLSTLLSHKSSQNNLYPNTGSLIFFLSETC